ncbi:hypothetical protein PENTCL1PPCAC_22278, partial [Pristionchus entomophagus]
FVAKNGMDKLLRKKRREMNDDEEEKTSASAFSIASNKTVVTGEIKKEENEREEEVEESIISRRSSGLLVNSKTGRIIEPPQKKSKSTKTDEMTKSSTSSTVEVATSNNPVKGDRPMSTNRLGAKDSQNNISNDVSLSIAKALLYKDPRFPQSHADRRWEWKPEELQMKARWLLPKINSTHKTHFSIIDVIIHINFLRNSARKGDRTKNPLIPFGESIEMVEIAINSSVSKEGEKKKSRDSTSTGSAKNAMEIDQSEELIFSLWLLVTPCGSEVKQPTHERKDDHQKQPLRVVKKSNEDKSAENEEDEEGEVSCICGQTEGDGKPMVQCDTCKVWRHILCVFPETKRAPKGRYECYKCILCPERAIFHEDQLKKIQELKQREK